MLEIKVPTVGESISEVTLAKWDKKDGDYVERDEILCELESEKATFELNAEEAGILKTMAKEGDTLAIGAVVATIDTSVVHPQPETGTGSAGTQPAVHDPQPSEGVRHLADATRNAQPATDIKAPP